MPFYHMILPVAGTNLVSNPSAELNATGWAGTVSGNANRQAGTATFGGWAIGGTPAAGANSGITYGTVAVAAGSYTVSAYIFGGSGSVYSIGMKGTGAGAAFVGSTIGTTGGTWHRYSFSYGESGAQQRLFAVIKRTAGVDPFFVDGVQVEGGTFQTTYIDGNQDGCIWNGAPNASTSQRSGTSRLGGTVVDLQSLGLTVLEHGGVGMPPVSNITQEYAIADGALWQRQRATSRVLTLTGLMSGTTWQGLHAIRANVVNALKIDRSPNPQPVRLLYTGNGGTSTIDAYYDGGMSFDSRSGFSETAAVRLLAPDPYWYATTDDGTALAPQVLFGSANHIVYRDPAGRWGTLANNGTSLIYSPSPTLTEVFGIAATQGSVYVVGQFGTAGGTAANNVAVFSGGNWGTLRNGLNNNASSVVRTADGTVYVGGGFNAANGTTALRIAFFVNNNWGTLPTGGVGGNSVNTFLAAPTGTLFLGGDFGDVGGTASANIGMLVNGQFGTLTGGTLNSIVSTLAYGPEGAIYVGGQFGSAGGTGNAGSVARWNGAWGTLRGGGNGNTGGLAVAPNGLIYATGGFTVMGGGSALRAAAWNGNQWQALGAGLDAIGREVVTLPTGQAYIVGQFGSAGGVALPDGAAAWNGAAWTPFDFDSETFVRFNYITSDEAGTVYLGGNFYGSAQAAAITTVVNDGAAVAYPVAVIRNTGATAARLYQLLNTTTGDNLWFNIAVQPNETLTLDLRNGQKTFTSNLRGNMLGVVLPGSNLTTWRITPGTNTLSVFAASGSVETTFYWRARAWSSDPRL